MDKFVYRVTFQPLIKLVLVLIINMSTTTLLYSILEAIFVSLATALCYWIFLVLSFATTGVSCFFLISVKDDFKYSDTETGSVGKHWCKRVWKNKPLHWFWLRLSILPMLLFAVCCGISFYLNHAQIFASSREAILPKSTDLYFYFNNLLHYGKIIFAIFFAWQWFHVRKFCKMGRCKKCKAAFSYGTVSAGTGEVTHSAKIKTKNKTVVVGERHNVTYEDGVEVDRTKVADIYGSAKEYYLEQMKTTSYRNKCRCAFCKDSSVRTDYYSSYSSTKLSK